MAQTRQDVKPFYGPPMTSSIFATKWLAKFRDFLLHRHRNHSYKAHEPRLCVLTSEGFDHVFHFHAQATELRLSQKDFPKEAPLPPWSNLQDNCVLPVEHLGIAVVNPFEASVTMLFMLDRFVEQLEGMKIKGKTMEGMTWRDLPLRWRLRMDDLFEKVDEARETGWWLFPKPDKFAAMIQASMAAKSKKVDIGLDEEEASLGG
ncbi:hypothetical protein M409DRAFT_29300 [Zasmidium cellare ATCC 36951]|uniref:Uncharacterized protein n=1 Tax=Zasmidium cellare ATCC 36951 TaxID=1080233 RepID=A0A6A6BZS6_ZASCE|nr:uncharacterized protein M409DRAFT_29300 [Zasmidium cellare ATCC 36951]KAF2160215.1 hypothetical protein M409DRAFT_29300 [Zasmidium cellare ATCC 36951]